MSKPDDWYEWSAGRSVDAVVRRLGHIFRATRDIVEDVTAEFKMYLDLTINENRKVPLNPFIPWVSRE